MLIYDIIYDVSNRRKHFIGGLITGFLFTILFTLGIATGMEFKDKNNLNNWDWSDWFATVIGGILGNCLSAILIIISI